MHSGIAVAEPSDAQRIREMQQTWRALRVFGDECETLLDLSADIAIRQGRPKPYQFARAQRAVERLNAVLKFLEKRIV